MTEREIIRQYEKENLTKEKYGFCVVAKTEKSAIILSLQGYCVCGPKKDIYYLNGINVLELLKPN